MTMAASYNVTAVPEPAPDLFEPMGSKEKFWFRMPGDERPWLFKYPREGTGEARAEKIAAEIAAEFGICHAQVDLAVHAGRNGTKLAGYFVLDAMICNTDRHHDSWGLLTGPRAFGGNEYIVAPTFDHASSLGRELQDERREEMLNTEGFRRYIATVAKSFCAGVLAASLEALLEDR